MSRELNLDYSQKITPNILKRCKNVIEELQQQLNKVTKENRQKQNLLEILSSEKNYFMLQYKQNQSLIMQLKNANLTLKNQLISMRNDKTNDNIIAELKTQLNLKQKQVQQSKNYNKSLEEQIKIQQTNQRKLDQQWQSLLIEVNQKIKTLQLQTNNKNQQISQLKMVLETKKCLCQQTVQQIRHMSNAIQQKYKGPIRHQSPIRKNKAIKQNQIEYSKGSQVKINSQQSRQTKSTSKYESASRGRINNSAYLTSGNLNKNLNNIDIKPYTISDSKINKFKVDGIQAQKKSIFFYQTFQKDLSNTKNNLKKQFEELNNNNTPRLDRKKVQRTLNELQAKLSKMVRKIQNSESDSCLE